MATPRRVRRTPAQARDEILNAARTRLLTDGIEGLRITGIANDVDMSHATLLHHFGSSDGMRAALADRMGSQLLAELLTMLDDSPLQPEQRKAWLQKTFATLADPRHGQLFAWLALQPTNPDSAAVTQVAPTAALFAELLQRMQRRMPLAQARFIVTLVVTSAIGMAVSRNWLEAVGLPADEAALAQFVERFAALLPAPDAPPTKPAGNV